MSQLAVPPYVIHFRPGVEWHCGTRGWAQDARAALACVISTRVRFEQKTRGTGQTSLQLLTTASDRFRMRCISVGYLLLTGLPEALGASRWSK